MTKGGEVFLPLQVYKLGRFVTPMEELGWLVTLRERTYNRIFFTFYIIYLNQLSTERKSCSSRRCPDAGVGAGFRRGATGWLLGGGWSLAE